MRHDLLPKENKVTIYDVAKLADTSATTVSRVLSGSDYPVSGPLKARIFEAAKEQRESGYRSDHPYDIQSVLFVGDFGDRKGSEPERLQSFVV